MLRRGLALRSPALAPRATRLLSSRFAPKPVPPGSAYAVLGVGRDIDDDSLRRAYKELAKEWHPDRHQGEKRDEAETKFQEISEAFQTLSDQSARVKYDSALDAAQSEEEVKKAAQRFRATSWNTEVPDVQARLRKAKREEPGMPPHIIAGTLVLLTGNFILALNWLGG